MRGRVPARGQVDGERISRLSADKPQLRGYRPDPGGFGPAPGRRGRDLRRCRGDLRRSGAEVPRQEAERSRPVLSQGGGGGRGGGRSVLCRGWKRLEWVRRGAEGRRIRERLCLFLVCWSARGVVARWRGGDRAGTGYETTSVSMAVTALGLAGGVGEEGSLASTGERADGRRRAGATPGNRSRCCGSCR